MSTRCCARFSDRMHDIESYAYVYKQPMIISRPRQPAFHTRGGSAGGAAVATMKQMDATFERSSTLPASEQLESRKHGRFLPFSVQNKCYSGCKCAGWCRACPHGASQQRISIRWAARREWWIPHHSHPVRYPVSIYELLRWRILSRGLLNRHVV